MFKINTMKATLTGLTIGGLLATAVALLYAPNSGEKTRQWLGNRSEKALENTRRFIRETQQSANQLLTAKAKDALDEASILLNHGQEYVDAARQTVDREDPIA